tara:strand:- start:2656 stop:3087 length:432 start_codon:yes stop_codon:yes gene_type:complete
VIASDTIRIFCFLSLFCPILLSGCAGNAPSDARDRAITFGAVQFSGNPVAEGQISFIPLKGPTAMGPIREGNYRIDSKGGVPSGVCKVRILAFEETGKEQVIGAGGKTMKETRQVVPARYNQNSTLEVTINSGEENRRDFDLK